MGGGAASDPTKWSLFGRKAACDSFRAPGQGGGRGRLTSAASPAGLATPSRSSRPSQACSSPPMRASRRSSAMPTRSCRAHATSSSTERRPEGIFQKPPGRPPVGHAFAPTLGKYIDLKSGKAYGDLTQEEKAKRMKTMKREAGCAGSGCSLAQFIISSAEDAGGARLGHVRARDGALLLALLLLEVGAADGLVELALLLGAV